MLVVLTSSFNKVVFSPVHAALRWIMESLPWVMVSVMVVPNIGWLKTPEEKIGGKKDTLGCKLQMPQKEQSKNKEKQKEKKNVKTPKSLIKERNKVNTL
ncbi:unnamed protein product [Trifolium pratense]|uniref:Uncharacterized protein n=1 Tax=Trifolium pratense TaxID=57577 RepID=A0ACB0JE33_TRIPR|nr:unnamed protein product [Trifolium pratense]